MTGAPSSTPGSATACIDSVGRLGAAGGVTAWAGGGVTAWNGGGVVRRISGGGCVGVGDIGGGTVDIIGWVVRDGGALEGVGT